MNSYSYVHITMKGASMEYTKYDGIETCDCVEIHEEMQEHIAGHLPEEDELIDLAELFKVFGDSTRIKILYVLLEADVCVCDIAQALGMTQSAVSHQLSILKKAKLVNGKREGKSIVYSLADEHVKLIISQGMNHIKE